MGLFSFMLSNNINKLQSYPSNVEITVTYVTPLDFPTVTICNENKYRYFTNSDLLLIIQMQVFIVQEYEKSNIGKIMHANIGKINTIV